MAALPRHGRDGVTDDSGRCEDAKPSSSSGSNPPVPVGEAASAWGQSIIASPEYQSEQRDRNREVSALIEQMKLEQEAQPTSEPEGLGFYLGGPYHDGTYSICEVATGRVRHIFNPATDDHHIEGSKYNSRGVNTTSEAPAVVDPTDPGHDVEVLRNHVRVLERRVRDLHRERNEAPAAKAVRMLTSEEIDDLVQTCFMSEASARGIIKLAAYKLLEVNGLTLSGAAGVPQPIQPKLSVWFGSMPESNGKANWTAILHRGDIADGFTLARSEYKDRVRYDADCVRFLVGELDKEPFIRDYDGELIEHADDAEYAEWQKLSSGVPQEPSADGVNTDGGKSNGS